MRQRDGNEFGLSTIAVQSRQLELILWCRFIAIAITVAH